VAAIARRGSERDRSRSREFLPARRLAEEGRPRQRNAGPDADASATRSASSVGRVGSRTRLRQALLTAPTGAGASVELGLDRAGYVYYRTSTVQNDAIVHRRDRFSAPSATARPGVGRGPERHSGGGRASHRRSRQERVPAAASQSDGVRPCVHEGRVGRRSRPIVAGLLAF
jgi:hypothetical protein